MRRRTRIRGKSKKRITLKRRYIGGSRSIDMEKFQRIYDDAFDASFQISSPVEIHSDGTLTRLGRCMQNELRVGEEVGKNTCYTVSRKNAQELQSIYRSLLNYYANILINIANEEPGYIAPKKDIVIAYGALENQLIGERDSSLHALLSKAHATLFKCVLKLDIDKNYIRRSGQITHEIHLKPLESVDV